MASAKQKGGLGRGLGALIAAEPSSELSPNVVHEIPIDEVYPNHDQPRKRFDKERLQELADSIKENGVIIPLIVTRTEKGHQIVAGERRWRASKLAGLKEVPVIIRELSDVEILQQALIENIQRQDLNPLEEAEALKRLISDYNMKQEEISKIVGRSRPAIANFLRLLNLSQKVKDMLIHEELSAGHARALLPIVDEELQVETAQHIIEEQLSVRQTEKLVKKVLDPSTKDRSQASMDPAYLLSVKEVEERLRTSLGTKVKLNDKNNKGTIVISYYSNDDLQRIIEKLN